MGGRACAGAREPGSACVQACFLPFIVLAVVAFRLLPPPPLPTTPTLPPTHPPHPQGAISSNLRKLHAAKRAFNKHKPQAVLYIDRLDAGRRDMADLNVSRGNIYLSTVN